MKYPKLLNRLLNMPAFGNQWNVMERFSQSGLESPWFFLERKRQKNELLFIKEAYEETLQILDKLEGQFGKR